LFIGLLYHTSKGLFNIAIDGPPEHAIKVEATKDKTNINAVLFSIILNSISSY